MKKVLVIICCLVMLLSLAGCGASNVSKAKMVSLNFTAKGIQSDISDFWDEFYSKGFGMESEPNVQEIFITVVNGEWTVYPFNPDYFRSPSRWGTTGKAKYGDKDSDDVKSGETKLAIYLTNSINIGGLKNGSIYAVCVAGEDKCICTFAAFTESTTNKLVPGTDCPTVDSEGFPLSPFSWNGKKAGISKSGLAVGAYPEISLA